MSREHARAEAAGENHATHDHPLHVALPYDIKPRAEAAQHNKQLQLFVNRATLHKDRGRAEAFQRVFGERLNAARQHAGAIKQHTLDHLDFYIEQFVDNATRAGAIVHFARDAAMANDITLAIARKKGSRLCVKAKSMVTEEMQLVPALQAAGVETIETDLGEFILQLDRDAPSHIVTPMIHKDRVATANAFRRELGIDCSDDPNELSMIARRYLREKYRRADLGITGGNFLVAETGTLVLCTNEGNAEFCTNGPKVHVALVGIEKLVPKLEHVGVLLKMLARGSTAQPLTVYTHLITGPRRPHEPDGPDELHIVLVDNGRTEILKEETREMLRCIRCGACLNACPVYRKIGGHAYGAVYSGPIGKLITPMFGGLENYTDLPYASSLCGACFEACPVHINIPKYLVRLREMIVQRRLDHPIARWIYLQWGRAIVDPRRFARAARWQRFFARAWAWLGGSAPAPDDPYADRGWLSQAPPPLSNWTRERDLPTPTSKSFRDWWRGRCEQSRSNQSRFEQSPDRKRGGLTEPPPGGTA